MYRKSEDWNVLYSLGGFCEAFAEFSACEDWNLIWRGKCWVVKLDSEIRTTILQSKHNQMQLLLHQLESDLIKLLHNFWWAKNLYKDLKRLLIIKMKLWKWNLRKPQNVSKLCNDLSFTSGKFPSKISWKFNQTQAYGNRVIKSSFCEQAEKKCWLDKEFAENLFSSSEGFFFCSTVLNDFLAWEYSKGDSSI